MGSPAPLVPNTRNYLGNYLRRLRKKHGRSLQYVADKLNVSTTYAYFIESGRSVTRDKKFLKSWVSFLSDGRESPEMVFKLAAITFPEMNVRIAKLGVDDRVRLLALIQQIHLEGMPKAVADVIDSSIINPNGVVIRMKNTGANIPEIHKRPTVQQQLNYEDFFVDPTTLGLKDAGTHENAKFNDFLLTPGEEIAGEKGVGAFDG